MANTIPNRQAICDTLLARAARIRISWFFAATPGGPRP